MFSCIKRYFNPTVEQRMRQYLKQAQDQQMADELQRLRAEAAMAYQGVLIKHLQGVVDQIDKQHAEAAAARRLDDHPALD